MRAVEDAAADVCRLVAIRVSSHALTSGGQQVGPSALCLKARIVCVFMHGVVSALLKRRAPDREVDRAV